MSQQIGIRPFGEVLLDLAGGDLEKKLTAELADVVRAVEATGKSGKLDIKLTVARDAKVLRITCESKTTIPKESVEATAFFTDEHGGLHRENPRQATMTFNPRITKDPS
jgi:hypothetical protein